MRIFCRSIYACIILIIILTPGGCGGSCNGGKSDSDSALIALLFKSPRVKTGEEVLLNASDFFNPDILADPLYAKYEWTISDDTTPPVEGRSFTHVFTNPGTYTVTLTVTQGVLTDQGSRIDEEWDDTYEFPADNAMTFQKSIKVRGADPLLPPLVSAIPLLELPFEDSIADQSPHNRTVEWADGEGSFVHGIKGKALDVSGGKHIMVKRPSSWLGGLGEFTISFWARKKDKSKEDNCFLSMEGADGHVLIWNIFNDASEPNNCHYRLRMRSGGLVQTTSIYTRDAYEDTLWHHYAVAYSNSEGRSRLYIDGREVATSSYSGVLDSPNDDLLIGFESATGAFNGYMDEFRIYDRALTARDLSVGFEIWHADIHARTAQYLYVQIPEKGTCDTANRLRVTVKGGPLGLFRRTLADKTGLQQEEKILLDNSLLRGSARNYTLNATVYNASGAVVFSTSEPFRKTYRGIPPVAIDENNSLRVNGELFFPVTPWGLNNDDITPWSSGGYVSALFGQGFWGNGANPPSYTIDGYRQYLDLGTAAHLRTIGPAMWKGMGHQTRYFFQKSSDPDMIRSYADTLGSHDGILMWDWIDEPELNQVSAPVLRSWTAMTHAHDGLHPVSVNFMGHPYSYLNGSGSWWSNERHTYTYGHNKGMFGMRKPSADIVWFDYYPLDAVRTDAEDTMHRLTTILDTMRQENYDLLPVMSCVETVNAGGQDPYNDETPWAPSPEQLRMIAWLNVVHEAKGILWFHYFGETPAANYSEMENFTRQITELTPAVLGPRISRTASIDYGGQTGRIDTMLREYEGSIYLFAVRVSEAAYQDPSATTPPPPAQNYTLANVTFDLGDGISNQEASVYGEGRTVALSNGRISDSFAPYAVHMYIVAE